MFPGCRIKEIISRLTNYAECNMAKDSASYLNNFNWQLKQQKGLVHYSEYMKLCVITFRKGT